MLGSFWQRPARSGANGRRAGRLRADARTKNLCLRLRPGEVAVIDHADLDGAAAYALLERQPAAVINAAPFVTGRYPNSGPGILLRAGIPLFETRARDLLERVREGEWAEVRDRELHVGGAAVAPLVALDEEALEGRLEASRHNLKRELQSFAENTLEYLSREAELALADLPIPPLGVSIQNRPVLVVARGEGYKQDLQWVLRFIREQKPILIGVDGGADALLEAGHRPHLIVGDMDSASEAALRCGAELIVHAYPDGRRSPGSARLKELGLVGKELAAPGTSEDVAMLLAHQAGASLIAVVGTHFSMVEFLDKRRQGMASTFLTRLKVGSTLIDAKGLGRLYQPALPGSLLVAMVVSALLPILVVIVTSGGARRLLSVLWMTVEIWFRRHGLR
jgi:uncharacterized membrane-anchored protein